MPRGIPKVEAQVEIKTPKAQVQKNRAQGLAFENYILKYLTKYLKSRNIRGIVYKLPSKLHYDQPIDILVDSAEWGYVGIECKSIKDSNLSGGKIRLNDLSREHAIYGHQFKKEHEFLKSGGRYGLVALKLISSKITIFVPHQYVYDKIENGFKHIYINDLIKMGYNIKNNKNSLKIYIHKNCRTV